MNEATGHSGTKVEPRMPDRWLHVRQPRGFDATMFDVFCASAEVFVAHASALLRVYRRLPGHHDHPRVELVFHAPELSDDRTTASLRISGDNSVSTRSAIEIGCSYLLWQHFPMAFMEDLEQGRTEAGVTEWWPPWTSISIISADPEWCRRMRAFGGQDDAWHSPTTAWRAESALRIKPRVSNANPGLVSRFRAAPKGRASLPSQLARQALALVNDGQPPGNDARAPIQGAHGDMDLDPGFAALTLGFQQRASGARAEASSAVPQRHVP